MNQNTPISVCIHGGTLAGVAAALELKSIGFEVWLSTHRSYLGEDVCDPLRLILPKDLDSQHPHLLRLFPELSRMEGFFRPMALKRELDRLLLEHNIPVLFNSMPGEVFVDNQGLVSGISYCSRSGRSIRRCQVIIDATVHGDLLRTAAVPLSAPDKSIDVVRRVVGGEPMGARPMD
ncbi:MAG: FAD-dependent oxidoreductase [Verrucomicrobia bacterium]|nr:FAD-dependent oxidoreductase [Verrucomicrobiota bacterium]